MSVHSWLAGMDASAPMSSALSDSGVLQNFMTSQDSSGFLAFLGMNMPELRAWVVGFWASGPVGG